MSEKEVERDRFAGRRLEAGMLSISVGQGQIVSIQTVDMLTISALEPGRLDRPILVLPLERLNQFRSHLERIVAIEHSDDCRL